MIYLYYAGMSAWNKFKTEQIGLAFFFYRRSRIYRINNDGLMLPIDPKSDWMSSMTCNPTVLRLRMENSSCFSGNSK